MLEDQVSTNATSGTSKHQKEEFEFTQIVKSNDHAEKSIYRPPPPDWALNDDGIEKSNNQMLIQARIIANRDRSARYKYHQSTSESLSSQCNGHIEDVKVDIAIPERCEDPNDQDQDNQSEFLRTISQSSINVEAVEAVEAVDAVSRPKNVQSIPATFSDPGPLPMLAMGHNTVPSSQSRRIRRTRQMAVDEPSPFSYGYGQYSTLF